MSKPAPVVLFTYNRLQHTRAVVEALCGISWLPTLH